MTTYWCEQAWVDGSVQDSVLIEADKTGVITHTAMGAPPSTGSTRLAGLTFPGFANSHSHAFHRALRGSNSSAGDFWMWRQEMYRLAERLDPDSYLQLATAVFAEMALSGFTLVGEFHYLHHQPGGRPYAEPNAMGHMLIEAARRAGLRLTLLDTCYLAGGIGKALETQQRRFADADVETWATRHNELRAPAGVRIGAAVHSLRAVPRLALAAVAAADEEAPLHIHLSEHVAENEQVMAAYGATPTEILAAEGLLTERLTAVHAIHLAPGDIDLLVGGGAVVCACPTTEADLADGIGPFASIHDRGGKIALGTDQHVSIDPFAEARRMELDQRLVLGTREKFSSKDLVRSLAGHGYHALGWPHGGEIAPGRLCDLTSILTDSVRTAGVEDDRLVMTAASADVHSVIVGAIPIVTNGEHRLGNVAHLLEQSISSLRG